MNNELIEEKSFLRRNWFWLVAILTILFIGLLFSDVGRNFKNLAHAYSNPILIETAIQKANENHEIINSFGKLAPVDKLAILEGSSLYSNDNKSVAITIRVVGQKETGKMDITADQNAGIWKYRSIKVRNRKINKEVEINPY